MSTSGIAGRPPDGRNKSEGVIKKGFDGNGVICEPRAFPARPVGRAEASYQKAYGKAERKKERRGVQKFRDRVTHQGAVTESHILRNAPFQLR